MSTENSNPTGTGSISLNEAASLLISPEEGQETEDAQQDETVDNETDEDIESDGEESESESDDDESDDDGESDEDEEQDEESEQPQLVKVKVDGEEVEVTLDELKSGYSRTKDYTRKTQELAEQRKAFEAEATAIREERQVYGQLLNQLHQQIQASQGQEPDWDYLRQTDPIEYSLQWAEWSRKQTQRQAIEQEQQRLQQTQMQELMQTQQQRLAKEQEALVTVLPDWKNAEVRQKEKALVIEQGKKLGFSEQELKAATDHRAIVALLKAAKYDAMLAKKESLKPAVKGKVLKPNAKQSAPTNTSKRALERLRAPSGGSMMDAVEALKGIL